MSKELSIAILTGGQSSRMGTNKAFTRIGDETLIERIIRRVSPLGSDLFLVANEPEEYLPLGLPVYSDIIPRKGPLGGLYTALKKAKQDYVLVVSCDQPFLNTDLLRYQSSVKAGYDVVVPVDRENYPQSMHALYGKGCIPPIQSDLEADRLKAIGFYKYVRVRTVTNEEIDRFDPQRWSFFNVNTPEQLEEARKLANSIP